MARSFPRYLLSRLCLGVCILLGFSAISTWAQITQGNISVTVTDQNGAVGQGADVVLQDLATNVTRTGSTGAAGTYTFAGLPTGNYRLTVSKYGLESQELDSVAVADTRVTGLKAALELGSV